MSLTDQALTILGESDLIHDPLSELSSARSCSGESATPAAFSPPGLLELRRNLRRVRIESLVGARPH
jgi:hypothetical protein